MNDWDCITDKQCEAGGLLLGQVRMCDLAVFAGAVASFEHEFKRGGLLYDFYRKDESLHEAVFERYRDAMGLMVVACCREQVAEALDMLAAADAVLKLNQPFFMRERHADDGKTNWFDGVQALLVCGHDLAAVQHYTFGAFVGFAQAVGRYQQTQFKLMAAAVRQGRFASDKEFKKMMEE